MKTRVAQPLATMAMLIISAGAATAAPAAVTVTVAKGANGSHVVQGQFQAAASVDVMWETLTDYDGLDEFVSSVRESKAGPGPVVEQSMAGRVGPFRKNIIVKLAIDESPKTRIAFVDYDKQSFLRYEGSWEIREEAGGVTVIYELEARPRFFTPSFIAGSAFRKSVASLLSEVRAEALKREERRGAP